MMIVPETILLENHSEKIYFHLRENMKFSELKKLSFGELKQENFRSAIFHDQNKVSSTDDLSLD